MIELPESIKIKMLADAGFPPTSLQEKYITLINFLNYIKNNPNDLNLKIKYLFESIGEAISE